MIPEFFSALILSLAKFDYFESVLLLFYFVSLFCLILCEIFLNGMFLSSSFFPLLWGNGVGVRVHVCACECVLFCSS